MSDHILYGGEVELVFNPTSSKYRYTVTDRAKSLTNEAVRGVTSVLSNIIAKPDLMTWPMNMANKFLFGSKFDEVTKSYICDWSTAALKPDTPMTAEELQNLMMDGSRQWTKRSDQGKDIGTLVHSAVEHYLRGTETPLESVFSASESDIQAEDKTMVTKAYNAFVSWWESLAEKEVLSVERVIYSRQMNYAGTFDLLAKINGKTYLLDLKTTNASKKAPMGIYSEYFLQLGAYSHAMTEENQTQIDDLGIIRVGKDGKLFVATAKDIGLTVEVCERAFAFAARLQDFLSTTTPFLTDIHFNSHLTAGKVDDTSSNK